MNKTKQTQELRLRERHTFLQRLLVILHRASEDGLLLAYLPQSSISSSVVVPVRFCKSIATSALLSVKMQGFWLCIVHIEDSIAGL